MDKANEIIRIMKKYGVTMTPLSLACKDYTMIWLDSDTDKVFVKWADIYGNDGVEELTELPPYKLLQIYNDLKRDFD